MHFYMFSIWLLILPSVIHGKPSKKDEFWIPRLLKKDLEGYTLISRNPMTSLFRFTFYRDVSILFYPIPEDVEEVKFTFKAHEEKLSLLGGPCVPQSIDIYIKQGGIAVVNPTNISFPKDFVKNDLRNSIEPLNIISDDSNSSLVLKNPAPGEWFGIAFVSWKDPKADKIEQQGIAAVCDTILYTDLRLRKANVSIIDCGKNINITLKKNSSTTKDIYKCYLGYETNYTLFNLSVISCDSCQWAVFRVQSQSLPDAKNNLVQCYTKLNNTTVGNIILSFSNHPKTWHYLEVLYGEHSENITNIPLCEISVPAVEEIKDVNMTVIQLVRDTKSEYFSFDYNLPPDDFNEHLPTLLNISSGNIISMKFDIFPVQDVGGTLSLGATLKMGMKYYMGFKRKTTDSLEYRFSDGDEFFKVVICTGIGKPFIPHVNESCSRNGIWQEATIVINSTDSDSISNIVHVPYPEIGTWYVTLALFCDKESVCPCKVVQEKNVTNYIVSQNNTEYNGTDVRIGSEKCNTSVVFSVSSSSCLGGKCGVNGVCNFYMSGGLIFSSCRCKAGYAGWDCSDTSNIIPESVTLMSVLFLTLSNLLFLPSIFFAVQRKYYTEALVYFFTMFFSIFYHACDVTDSNYALCIVRLGVLQYCDFFCGLLSFWVTLVAMAALDNNIVSLLHMFGTIMIAFGTELDKQALLVFLIPVLVGVCIVITAWMFRCRTTKKMFPAKTYLVLFLPVGLILASIGLICYAFLQTNANYHIVHSVWHMIIALSVLCLLPNRIYFMPKS